MSAMAWKATTTRSGGSGRRRSMPTPRAPPMRRRWRSEHLGKIGAAGARIGIEPGFLPADAQAVLAARLEGARFVDATGGAGAAAGGQDAGGARQAAARVGAHHRRDAGDDRLGARGDDQGRDHRAAAARGGRARAAFRLLPADARGEPQPRALGPGLGGGRGAVDRLGRQPRRLYRRSLRAWACSASRMRSSRTCWPRWRRCSRRPSRRCGPERPAARSGRGRSR